ncbi:neural cell adhesion molecule 2-like [Pelmatolapia mariae]|uniref:neural cell adhesion molecule 2-like n=1 Tax=Pelmatolapia mariae TaxID=158779 RepID=UPI002FE500EE
MSAEITSLLLFVVFVSAEPTIIIQSGQDVTLTCRAPNDSIRVLKWRREVLETESVLLYPGGHLVPDDQHPSFKNRVDLQDRQMKDGDVSLILKNVMPDDAGTYECHVYMEETRSWNLINSIHLSVPPDPTIITAESGQNVTLTCRAPSNIRDIKWSRADMESKYVLSYWNGHFDQSNQHPSFKNRVDLQDRQMKDGDVSLILKDVTINDAGTYMCDVLMAGIFSWEPIRLILLSVSPDPTIIKAEAGQNVTLTCRAPNNNIMVVKWKREVLETESVLLYRDGQFKQYNQHPSFKNRVDLQDRQMKDGDVSLILKDVTINDAGTYECRVLMEDTLSWEIISIHLTVVVRPDQKNITAESGQNVTLTCRAPNNNIRVVKWSRADLEDKNILSFRDGQFDPDSQHPSFKNRVDLQDRQMKDGDVSLILKDVTINDAETYKCQVFIRETRSWQLVSIITLSVVDPPGQTGGHTEDGGKKEDGSVGLLLGLSVSAVFLVAVVIVFLIYRQYKRQNRDFN